MGIEQICTGCLTHAAFYLERKGEAAIFNPLHKVQPYFDRSAYIGLTTLAMAGAIVCSSWMYGRDNY